jgi:O-antigen ligase
VGETRRGERAATAAAALLTAAAVTSSQIALVNFILLGVLIAAWIAWRDGAFVGRPWARELLWPAVAFVTLSTIAAFASLDPLVSLGQLPRLAVFALIPLAAALFDGRWWRRLVAGLGVATMILAVWGFVQYANGANSLEHRIQGPLSHYMTYSGWLTVAVLALLAHVVFDRSRAALVLLVPVAAGFVAIILSYTRNAWVGLGVGVLVLAARWRRRVLLAYPALALVVWLAFPRAVLDRALSIVDLRQPANYDRLCMISSGLQIVHDYPWTGVGLDMVSRIYPLYRRDDAPRWRVPHLHDNPLQIAAERGLPALAAYVWLLATFFVTVWRGGRRLDGPARAPAAAALVAVAGITAAGLFEYNFWDAEIQYLTFLIIGAGLGAVERAAGEDV